MDDLSKKRIEMIDRQISIKIKLLTEITDNRDWWILKRIQRIQKLIDEKYGILAELGLSLHSCLDKGVVE